MPTSEHSARLRRLALLYLGMAHRSHDSVTDAELESVIRRLVDRSESEDRDTVQTMVMDVLARFTGAEDPVDAVRCAGHELLDDLGQKERREVLKDLEQIAQADGIVLTHEHGMLESLAEVWKVSLSDEAERVDAGRWSVLHDLAYIYLVLAHGTDNDFSETEKQVMLNKLREWHPDAPEEDVHCMLRLAMREYAKGQDEQRLDAAIASVRTALPRNQRMAALNDMIKIANADGVFLDDEEDLINHLQAEWDVDPSANYEAHSDKTGH